MRNVYLVTTKQPPKCWPLWEMTPAGDFVRPRADYALETDAMVSRTVVTSRKAR
jgi:hypothetical protein